MSVHTGSADHQQGLRPDFAERLELSLPTADRERKRRAWYRRILSLLPFVLLVGPIVGWRLMLTSPDGVHVGIAALSWVTFLLDVGVHVDTTVLSYLGLAELPTIVGALVFIVLTCWLLANPGDVE